MRRVRGGQPRKTVGSAHAEGNDAPQRLQTYLGGNSLSLSSPTPHSTTTEQPMSLNSKQAVRSAAITGAGSGLGRDIALGLAEKGYEVFGTALTEAEIQDLKSASGGTVSL